MELSTFISTAELLGDYLDGFANDLDIPTGDDNDPNILAACSGICRRVLAYQPIERPPSTGMI